MDSKRTYKKLSTWFWWILTALPVILLIGYIIASIVNLNTQSGTPLTNNEIYDYWGGLDIYNLLDNSIFTQLSLLIPDILNTTIQELLENIGVDSPYLAIVLSWGISMQFYHVIFDIMVWLPHKCHELME